MFQIAIWVMGGIAAYRLWTDITWLSVLVILLAISYEVHPGEKEHHATHSEYSNATATRLAFTFFLVAGIFLFSIIR